MSGKNLLEQKGCNWMVTVLVGRTEKTKISKLTKFRVKFHVSIHRYGAHGLKKVIFVHFGLRSGPRR